MIDFLEVAGWAIIALALAQATVFLVGDLRRRVVEAHQTSERSRIFEERAEILLEATRRERQELELTWSGTRKFTVDRKVEEAKDVCSFYLKPHDGKHIPPFHPGQFLTFRLNIPGQAKPVIRCYSLSSSPLERDYYRVTIKRLGPPPKEPDAPPGLSSNYFHQQLNEGDILDVKAPDGSFYLKEDSSRPVVLIGGGVGLTPVLSMLDTISGSGSTRETWFFYGVTNRTDHAMYEHLAEIDRTHDNIHVVISYSQPTDNCVQGRDYDHAGYCGVDLFKERLPSNNYEFYICGPPPMMTAVTEGLQEWGVPVADIHFEAFGPATVKSNKTSKVLANASDGGGTFKVVFERSGKTCDWTPDSGSILEVAEANGVSIDYGCRAGNCGTCTSAVKEGEFTNISEPTADAGDKCCLACMAIPVSGMVIDA